MTRPADIPDNVRFVRFVRRPVGAADHFGPWAPGLDRVELTARLRSLRAIATLTLGPRGSAFTESLRRAETDAGELEPALRHLDALAALDRRRVLCSYAHLHRGGS